MQNFSTFKQILHTGISECRTERIFQPLNLSVSLSLSLLSVMIRYPHSPPSPCFQSFPVFHRRKYTSLTSDLLSYHTYRTPFSNYHPLSPVLLHTKCEPTRHIEHKIRLCKLFVLWWRVILDGIWLLAAWLILWSFTCPKGVIWGWRIKEVEF